MDAFFFFFFRFFDYLFIVLALQNDIVIQDEEARFSEQLQVWNLLKMLFNLFFFLMVCCVLFFFK